MRHTTQKLRLGSVVAAAVIVLAACGSKDSETSSSENTMSLEKVECSTQAGEAAFRKPIDGARRITVDEGAEAQVSHIRDKAGNELAELSPSEEDATTPTGISLVDGTMYARFADGAIEGVKDGEWIKLDAGIGNQMAVFDQTLTGSEKFDDNVHQAGYWFDPQSAKVVSYTAGDGDECEYKMSASAPDGEEYVIESLSMTTDGYGRVTGVAMKTEYDEAWNVSVSYGVEDVKAPEKVSSMSAEDVKNALEGASNQQSAITAAQSFDRQLRSIASYGDSVNNNPNDTDPRKPELLLELMYKGDVLDGFVPTSALSYGNLRVLVWQPGGATQAAKWTRVFCTTGETTAPCSGMDYSASSPSLNSGAAGTVSFVAGHLMNPTRANPAGDADPYPMCIQFHASGKDAFMGVSMAANSAGIISTSIQTACPGAMYGGASSNTPVASTGEYTDISASAAAGMMVKDPTWSK